LLLFSKYSSASSPFALEICVAGTSVLGGPPALPPFDWPVAHREEEHSEVHRTLSPYNGHVCRTLRNARQALRVQLLPDRRQELPRITSARILP
jgi:hypothetical protein